MKKTFKFALPATLLLAPVLAFAQFTHTAQLIVRIAYLIDALTVIVAALALLVFFYGLVKFIYAGANGKVEGKNFMVWGTIALFVMVSVWGLVHFIQSELLPGTDLSNPTVPSFTGRY